MKELRKSSLTIVRSYSVLVVILAAGVAGLGQNGTDPSRNNPYAPSPAGKSRSAAASHTEINKQVAFIIQPQDEKPNDGQKNTDFPTPFTASEAKGSSALALTEMYKVGVNDVLSIKIQNAASGSDYYTVRSDGSIDFPLAGRNVIVAGRTIPEIEAELRNSIKLYSDPRLEIKIREYGSHKVTVSGSVRNPGERNLQREAVPFYVIKAGSIIMQETTGVKITSDSNNTQVYDLHDPRLDSVLITPGMTIEFTSASTGSYFVTGKKVAVGEKALTRGLTVLQAVIAAGKTDGEAKKAIIRRRNSSGILSNMEFDLRAIRSGRIADPTLLTGDIIEIPN
jgi:protein involved in polysaccharide export with SLBB domain